MYIQQDSHQLETKGALDKRQGSNASPSQPRSDQTNAQTWTFVVSIIVAVIVVFTACFFAYSYTRRLKIAGRSPRYIPTKYLKRRWEEWKPKTKYANGSRYLSDSEIDRIAGVNRQTGEVSGVNRNASIRSIITLPAYSQKPKDTEEVIGREGERAGIDTVIELPESVQEEESRRDAEMESLYQIRQARRQEIAEREERRRERREARERGDFTRLDELRRETRERREQSSLANFAQNSASNVNLTAEMLMAEHNAQARDKRVSSVSYAALGQVRHDGTRVRSDSYESEQSGLLNGAAPMGSHTRNGSEATLLTLGGLPQTRNRDRSDSAATSIVSTSSFENVSPPGEVVQPLASRNAHSSPLGTRSLSETGFEEADIGSERLVVTNTTEILMPPDYEGHEWGEAPEYTPSEQVSRANSTVTARTAAGHLSRGPSTISRPDTLSVVPPSIYIETPTGPNTPVSPISIQEQLLPESMRTH